MPTKKRRLKRIKKEIPNLGGISYTAWHPEVIAEFPITEEDLDKPVKLAEDPKPRTYRLKAIKAPKSKSFPEGGYIIEDPTVPHNKDCVRPIFSDEIIPYPEPPPKRRRKRKAATKPKKATKPKPKPKAKKAEAKPKPKPKTAPKKKAAKVTRKSKK